MTGLIGQAALVLALGQGGTPGYATRYAEHLMHTAAANHGLSIADCMVSDDLAPLGTFVWIRGANTGRLLNCQVSDVSETRDRKRHMQAGLIELDWASARAICGEPAFDGPWKDCPVTVWR